MLTSHEYLSKEFISVAFSPQNDKSFLVTLVIYFTLLINRRCVIDWRARLEDNNMDVGQSKVFHVLAGGRDWKYAGESVLVS